MTEIAGDTQLQSDVLEDLRDAPNYQDWLSDLVRPHLGDDPIELGSGIGDHAVAWLTTAPRITVTEADDVRLKVLHDRFRDEPRVQVRPLVLPAGWETGEYSSVVALNVLEHIEDDVEALRSVCGMLRPGGAVVLIVPAFPSAMSRFDRSIGHFRRYTVASMRAALTAAGLRVDQVHYVNPIGLLNWYIACVFLRMTPRSGVLLRVYDRLVTPFARFLERRWRPPFGQSVFAVAYTPTD